MELTKEDLIKFFETAGKIHGISTVEAYHDFVDGAGWEEFVRNNPESYSEAFHQEVEGDILGGESQIMAGKKYLNELVKLADILDKKGLTAEANEVDKIVQSMNKSAI